MNAKEFETITGYKPEDDDLERVNCPKAGQIMHYCCGMCQCGKPKFICGHGVPTGPDKVR